MSVLDKYEFCLAKLEDEENLLKVRNQKETRSTSINKKIISIEEHQKWFREKLNSKFFHYYVLKDLNNEFIGLGYGEKFNISDKSCIWGIRVLTNLKKTDKFGSIILYLLFNKLFSLNEINKINCQVLKEFDWIKKWYIRWGHEMENFDEINGCFNLYLLKNKWNSIKNEMLKNL